MKNFEYLLIAIAIIIVGITGLHFNSRVDSNKFSLTNIAGYTAVLCGLAFIFLQIIKKIKPKVLKKRRAIKQVKPTQKTCSTLNLDGIKWKRG